MEVAMVLLEAEASEMLPSPLRLVDVPCIVTIIHEDWESDTDSAKSMIVKFPLLESRSRVVIAVSPFASLSGE